MRNELGVGFPELHSIGKVALLTAKKSGYASGNQHSLPQLGGIDTKLPLALVNLE